MIPELASKMLEAAFSEDSALRFDFATIFFLTGIDSATIKIHQPPSLSVSYLAAAIAAIILPAVTSNHVKFDECQ